jgi:peroxiredoxin Q/BCP
MKKELKGVVKEGDAAPLFSLPDQDGKQVELKQLLGKWVVLYFYPKDNTPGCTTEAVVFTSLVGQFSKIGAVVLGVSADSSESHVKFIEKHRLKISLLSDEAKTTIMEYGAWGTKTMYGKSVTGLIRSTFLISPDGKIALIWRKVKTKGHAEEVLAKLKEIRSR